VIIPVIIAAHNEERAIGHCLDSLIASARAAEERLPVRFHLITVLDDCTDGTRKVVEQRPGVEILLSSGGKVEAQRRATSLDAPFRVYADADLLADRDALGSLAQAMLEDRHLLAAFPKLEPLPPKRRTPLAKALHLYNLRRGFSSQRTWFNGKLFALRKISLPSREEVRSRARLLPKSKFFDYDQGLIADDILLSRRVLLLGGPNALRETDGCVRYRAPETLRGMYFYYRRLRREITRTNALFPETQGAHQTRVADLLAQAPLREKALHAIFQFALTICRAFYRLEVAASFEIDPWPAIAETKEL
jgi:glycosyltransferase involved in cell wall biosynthesis